MGINDNRRHIQPEKKYEIVKEVIMGKNPVSEVCKKYGINTGQYYKWQQAFFNGAIEGLRHKKNGRETAKEEKLIAENQRLRGVIAELASENLELKKSLGE
ncbi:MAG: transposase [Thermodesulfovibrionales bacterium]|nr:transposase [Thermodesulfovibrionales bacterium]